MTSLWEGLSGRASRETIDVLAEGVDVRVERIVSAGQATPPGQWYDQDLHEWVVVLRGRATLAFDGSGEVLTLDPGDHVTIPAHRRHRVEWTDPTQPTVWLAVHYRYDPGPVANLA
ncbi:MAG: cupin domain-containing protein [Candidatus Rokuibacteriota bacterium]